MGHKFLLLGTAIFLSVAGMVLAQSEPRTPPRHMPNMREEPGPVPAFHASPSRQALPHTMDPRSFPDTLNQNVYAMAGKVKNILYQQPCYCHCDQHVGHQSLLDCFVDTHGSMCAVCKSEAVYSFQQARKGEKAAAIRAAIIAGAWKSVDLTKYSTVSASQ